MKPTLQYSSINMHMLLVMQAIHYDRILEISDIHTQEEGVTFACSPADAGMIMRVCYPTCRITRVWNVQTLIDHLLVY